MTQVEAAVLLAALFEAELLVELMMRYWQHPCADDRETVKDLVETAAEVLKQSQAGTQFIEGILPHDMNFVAAVWYAEYCHVSDSRDADVEQRKVWLTRVRSSLPSCFCDPEQLIDF